MADPSPDSVFLKIVGGFIGTAIGGLILYLPTASTGILRSGLTVLGGLAGLAFHLMYKRYVGVLGAGGGRKGYPEREAYESLRESLSGGNIAARLYANWLRAFLDAVDRFFCDAEKA